MPLLLLRHKYLKQNKHLAKMPFLAFYFLLSTLPKSPSECCSKCKIPFCSMERRRVSDSSMPWHAMACGRMLSPHNVLPPLIFTTTCYDRLRPNLLRPLTTAYDPICYDRLRPLTTAYGGFSILFG